MVFIVVFFLLMSIAMLKGVIEIEIGMHVSRNAYQRHFLNGKTLYD